MTESLTVAVTGPTGTFGYGLMPLLQADPRVRKVVGIARRPFDPSAEGWDKMEYRRGDVRDEDALREAFAGADVVVHLAFLIVGGKKDTTRAINIQGTLNAFRAAAAAGATRFVYASSVAAYGFHRDNPVGMTEDWPTRPADKLFYAQEKAELEELLQAEAARHPELGLYLLRPPVVLGPHTVGGKAMLPGPLAPLNKHLQNGFRRLPVPVPAVVPDLPLQFIHEDDVGRALLQCVVAAGPAGAYNIAGDGVLSMVDVARELRIVPIKVSGRPVQKAARAITRLPLPSAGEWVEAFSHPAIMDTTRAKEVLGWEPQFTGLEALQDTLKG
ncbi:MAG: NAD-dependent epimerase/dehydratase [Frankiales bacterium]|jgi:nucleoside-diphosphate-sugar epimerase|nr:NAD-dependent epimerase/dehydratase [Frankiales bacterium]